MMDPQLHNSYVRAGGFGGGAQTVNFYDDRTMHVKSSRNENPEGQRFQMTQSDLEGLVASFEASPFYSMEPYYPSNDPFISEIRTVTKGYTHEEEHKTVTYYSRSHPPEELIAFNKLLHDKVLEISSQGNIVHDNVVYDIVVDDNVVQ